MTPQALLSGSAWALQLSASIERPQELLRTDPAHVIHWLALGPAVPASQGLAEHCLGW